MVGMRAAALVAALIGTGAGAGWYTFDYAEGSSYLSNDPRACVNCHVMRPFYDGWQKTSHHAFATCNDCHVPVDLVGKYWTKLEHGWRHSKGFTLQDFHEPIRIKDSSRAVVQENCLRCHGELTSPLLAHGAAHGGSSPRATDCIHCHSHVGHGPRK